MARTKPPFLSALGVTFEIFKAISNAVIEAGGDDESLRSLLNDPDKCRRVALEIVDREPALQTGSPYRGGVPADVSTDRIQVSDLTASELIALAKKELKLTYLDGDLVKWNFITDERGKTYEVQVWKPGREVVPAAEVREHFKDGFVGNTAAFVAWVTKHNPEGYHASIPEDARLFQDGSHLYAPGFFRDESRRKLGLYNDVRYRWYDSWCFVAFREFKSA